MTQQCRMAEGVNQLTTMGVCPLCEAVVFAVEASLKCAFCASTCHERCAIKRKELIHGAENVWHCDLCSLAHQQASTSKISDPDSFIKKKLQVIHSLCEESGQVLKKSSQMSCVKASSTLREALASLIHIQNEQMEIVKALTANMDEEKSKVKMMSTGTPATPPPTPTYPAMLADRRSANRNSTGNIVPLRTPAKGRVADVIDSFGRRRSSSCSESLPESPKYIGFPLAENGDGIKKSQSFFQYEGVLPSQVDSKPKVNTVPDARPTQPQEPQEKMDLSNEKEETPAKAKYAVMVAELDAEDYNMSHERRGYFLILNHDKFDCPNMDRPGSEVDVNELKTTAAALGFEPIICNNLTYQEISETINKVATMDHSNADCLGIAVLTHGEHHGYLHAKDCLYSVEKLWTPFTADACPTLAGKPKLFFIQACRGQRLDEGIAVRRTETDSGVNSYKIPSIADFLISYSTVDGYYSWRNPENGTWFIRSLCEELRDWAPRGKEFLQILVKVHARVAFQYQSFNEKDPSFDAKKQIPSFVCMLTRCLYLMPKETQTSAVGSDGKC